MSGDAAFFYFCTCFNQFIMLKDINVRYIFIFKIVLNNTMKILLDYDV